MTCYKIQDRETGLFSTGGAYPRFNKRGKLWSHKGAISSHLGGERARLPARGIPKEWDVLVYELLEPLRVPAQQFHQS